MCDPASAGSQASICRCHLVSRPEITFENNKDYVTREGKRVRLLNKDLAGNRLLFILLDNTGIPSVNLVTSQKNGRQYKDITHLFDIVSEYKEPDYRYCNLYRYDTNNLTFSSYSSKEYAEAQANGRFFKHTYRIDADSYEIVKIT